MSLDLVSFTTHNKLMATATSTPFAVSKDLQRPNSPGKIKFVCRWGGDLVQDNQGRLAYDGGETRLCTLPKAVRYRDFVTKLRELTGYASAALHCIGL